MGQRRREYTPGEWPWNHAQEIWYNEDGSLDYQHDWNSYNHSWDYTRHYTKVGETTRCSSAKMKGEGDYEISFDYYPNAEVKSAYLKTPHGNVKLSYSEDGKLETLEKSVNGKKQTYHYTYDADAKPEGVFTASGLYETYRKNDYINNTGGFSIFDGISSEENYDRYKERYGVSISCADKEQKKISGRAPTAEEAEIAFSMLGTRTSDRDSTTVMGRLEKTSSKDREIGRDAIVLDNGLVAVSKMFEHTAWERGDASWTPRGNGEQWTYELDGAIVDVNKKEIISSVSFSRVVRDSYDGSKDCHHLINSQTMLRADENVIEFFMGDKYHTVASEKVDTDKALKTHEGKKHIKQSVHEKSSEVASQGQETSNSSKPNNRGGNGGFGDGR